MKLQIIAGCLLLSSALLAAQLEVPEEVDKELTKSARSMSGSERNRYIMWQKRAYLKLEKIGEESGLPANEYRRIMNRLHQMYGSNYRKQLQVVDDEINDYKELVRRVNESVAAGKPDASANEEAKRELSSTIENTNIVPKEVLNLYKESAEELYPDNYVAQKKYMESIIKTYPKLIEWIKENRSILNWHWAAFMAA